MTFGERIKFIFNRGVTAPPDPGRFFFWPQLLDADGRYFSAQDALQLSVVWACVSVISRSIASCDWKVYERKDGKLVYLEDDALDYILNTRPNPEMTALAFKEALIASAAVWGNGYAEIVRDKADRVREIWPLDPEQVETVRADENNKQMVAPRVKEDGTLYYGELAYKVTQPSKQAILKASQVYHLRGPSLSGLLGENIVLRGAKSLVLTKAADEFATAYYRNSTVVGGFLETPRTLEEKTYQRLKADWTEKRSGPGNAHKPLFLEGGMKWVPLNDTSAASSQMLEARKFQVEEIARWFGVPLYMVGSLAGSQGYGTNLEQTGLEFQRSCLGPWAKRMEQEADWKFFPMRGPTSKKQTKVDLTPLSRGDAKTRAEAYAIMRRIGVYSANDILRLEGQNALPADIGDVRVIEASLSLYEELDARAEKAERDAEAPAPVPPQLGGPTTPETDTEEADTEDTMPPAGDPGAQE